LTDQDESSGINRIIEIIECNMWTGMVINQPKNIYCQRSRETNQNKTYSKNRMSCRKRNKRRWT